MYKITLLKIWHPLKIGLIFLFLLCVGQVPSSLLAQEANAQPISFIELTFDPLLSDITKTNEIGLIVNSGEFEVAYVKVEITYDPSKIVLVNDIQLDNKFSNVFIMTPRDEANRTGNINISAGLSTNYRLTPPKGRIIFAHLTFGPVNNPIARTTNVTITPSEVQVVDILAEKLPFIAQTATMATLEKVYLPFLKR